MYLVTLPGTFSRFLLLVQCKCDVLAESLMSFGFEVGLKQ